MNEGLHAELVIDCAGACPVAAAADDGRIESVSRARVDETVVEEFVHSPAPVGATGEAKQRTAGEAKQRAAGERGGGRGTGDATGPAVDVDPERIVRYDERDVYRFERPAGVGCPCEIVESHGVPVQATAAEGRLLLTLHPPDRETLGSVARALQARYRVELRRVIEGRPGERGSRDLAAVDRTRLTDRQFAALKTAHERGYFERPRGATGREVAAELGVAPSTFTEHLRAAQRKVLDAVCAGA